MADAAMVCSRRNLGRRVVACASESLGRDEVVSASSALLKPVLWHASGDRTGTTGMRRLSSFKPSLYRHIHQESGKGTSKTPSISSLIQMYEARGVAFGPAYRRV